MAAIPLVTPTASPIIKMYSDPKRTRHLEVDDTVNATIHTINFKGIDLVKVKSSGRIKDAGTDPRPRSQAGRLLTDKQIRARARRKYNRLVRQTENIVADEEFEWLHKPIEEWSLKELALGRPLPSDGSMPRGPKPKWVNMEVHEKAMELFVKAIKTSMNSNTIDAMSAINLILNDNNLDNRGKPLVSPSTKLDAAKFLIEHVVGKPTQHITQDISVRLQGLLGSVMVNPNEALASSMDGGMLGATLTEGAYNVAHFPGHTIPMGNEAQTLELEVQDALNDPDWLADFDLEDDA